MICNLTSIEKSILTLLEKYRILHITSRVNLNAEDYLQKELPYLSEDSIKHAINNLIMKKLIDDRFRLTPNGRSMIRVGLTGGVFDIIHIGHIRTLWEAKKYVDLLVVVIARDSTVIRMKKRPPINNERDRLEVISNLKPVDIAILGDNENFMKPVELVKPDYIILGYDQKIPPGLEDKLKNISIIKLGIYCEGYKSSNLRKKLINATI